MVGTKRNGNMVYFSGLISSKGFLPAYVRVSEPVPFPKPVLAPRKDLPES